MQKISMWNPDRQPKPILNPTPLRTMFSSADMRYITDNHLMFIGVQINGQSFFAKPDSIIPQQQTTILRDRANNITGLPSVCGG